MKIQSITCLLALAFLSSSASAETTYFFEDFEGPNANAPTAWYRTGETKLTEERAHSGKKSALIDSGGMAYFEIPLAKPLKWDRHAPDGIGHQPLYLSAWVYCASGGADARLGFRASIRPKHRPSSDGSPICDEVEANVGGRTNQWLHLCLDVGRLFRKAEAGDLFNVDEIVLESVSLITYSGGKFYIDDIRLSTEPPKDCTPPPPQPTVDAAQYYRSDPKLEGMVVNGVYGGIGSCLLGDVELHPWIVRDLKRHYINCAIGFDYRVTSPEPVFQAVDKVLDQAALYDFPLTLLSYIGDKYTEEAGAWPDDKLREEMLKVVRRFKNKSHLLAWYLEEESGWARTQRYLTQKRWVETEDPNHSCLTVFNARSGVETMGRAHALLITDLYEIQGPNSNPWYVPHRIGLDARQFHQPSVLTDQIFSGQGGWAMPTPGQWRLMVYGALAEGAKGFFHFVYSPELGYHVKTDPLAEGMTDPYGTSGEIYHEIEQQLGPDLFSFGELLRTCHPPDVPPGLSVECKTVEDSLERQIPALALRRHQDEKNGYDILAVYNNDPDQAQSGVLSLPKEWLKGRVVIDLDAHAQRITERQPILVKEEKVVLNLPPGNARFFAVTAKDKAPQLLERMWTRRLEAVRKMVEFDNQWLEKVGVRKSPVEPPAGKMPVLSKLERYLKLDQENQTLISQPPLGEVVKNLAEARRQLSAAYGSISQWARSTPGKPFPPEVEPGKSYCDTQDKLGELFVGCSDLAYRKPPGDLIKPTAELAALTQLQADHLQAASAQGLPKDPNAFPQDRVQALEENLHQLGWSKPPTIYELWGRK